MDFTLNTYESYLNEIKNFYPCILRFDKYLQLKKKTNKFCIIRHDVDRKPLNALKMAKLEYKLNIQTSYYFRANNNVFNQDIIKKIYELGHEIGYHYECLSEANGCLLKSLDIFQRNLIKFREIVPVTTISMHGRPLSPYDNREIWKNSKNYNLLAEKYNILGEIYLDIDYSDIAYINDTGRNWLATKSNLRDTVNSTIDINFKNGGKLLNYLKTKPHSKLVFQIHPERWNNSLAQWTIQYFKDKIINLIKFLLMIRYYFNRNAQ